MNKVIWLPNLVKYYYSKREPYYLKKYFKIVKQDAEYFVDYFEVVNDKYLIIEGQYEKGDILEADGIQYTYKIDHKDIGTQTNLPKEEKKETSDGSTQTDEPTTKEEGTQTSTETESTDISTKDEGTQTTDKTEATDESQKDKDKSSDIGLDKNGNMVISVDEDNSKTAIDKNTASGNSEEKKEKPIKPKHSDLFLELQSEEQIKIEDCIFTNLENRIYLLNPNFKQIKLKVTISEYTNETFPEFSHNVVKRKIDTKHDYLSIATVKKGTIVVLTVETENKTTADIKYENTPLYHFSNVKSLKQKIKDFKLGIELKDDDYYNKLISEKSIYLKRRFGLTENQTHNIEYFPMFKALVDLYCVYDTMSYTFIQGNPNINPDDGFSLEHEKELKLGKFKTAGDIEAGSTFAPRALRNQIKGLERDITDSLNNSPYLIKKYNSKYDLETIECNQLIHSYMLTQTLLSYKRNKKVHGIIPDVEV